MQIRYRRFFACMLLALAFVPAFTRASAQDEDLVHIVSGVVRHVDRDSRKLIIKTDDGAEHTIKWTGKTLWHGTKDSGEGIRKGAELTVRYTEKAGEKSAVEVKDLGKDVKKALQ